MKRKVPVKRKLSTQLERKVNKKDNESPFSFEYEGNANVVSTGSTLLDLAISGGRFEEGGIPTGILVEIFGPASAGKTVLLCQLAGNVQRKQGEIMFHDPEARLNKQFASMFGLDTGEIEYTVPDTIPQVFEAIRKWAPEENDDKIYGVFADSLAALSTDMEMEDKDKMGMRRAKEFSEELRKTCRIITHRNILVVCSNQVRQNLDAGPYGQRYKSPGGEAIGFYSSLRLRIISSEKIKQKKTIKGKEHSRITGIKTNIEVHKSSVWKPHRTAEIYIMYDYGIDDIRANLRYIKTITGNTVYTVGDIKLNRALENAILEVEEGGLEKELKKETINLWREVEEKFSMKRKPRMR